MKTTRLLAAMLLAAGLLQLPVAHAVSAAVAKPLKEASELVRAGKAKEALAKLNGVTGSGPDDTYMLARIRGAAYQRMGDNGATVQQLEAAFATGKVPGNEAGQLAETIAGIYAQQHNNAKAMQWVEKAKAAGDNGPGIRQIQDYVQGSSGDYGQVARDNAAKIQAAESAGRRPDEDDLLRLADAYRHTGNKAGDMQVKEKLVTYFPSNKQYVGIYLSDLPGKSGFSSRFSLDLLRLRLASGNLTAAADYMEMAQLLLQAGLPAEAKSVVDKGYAAGVLGTGAEASRQQRLRDLVTKTTTESAASIAKRAADAKAGKTGDDLVAIGAEYASMGKFDEGIDLIQQGIAKDSLKRPEDAKLRLGVAMLQSGKGKAGAVKQLRTVQGTDGAPEVARAYIAIGTGQ
jgi:tetratricopeptide (TPR) repeat protein